MKPIISLERRDAILAMENKRTQSICALMEGNHVDGLDEILRLVDRPVGTPEEIRNAPEDRHVNAISAWYDLLASACRWVQNIGLTMTDHVPVYWYDEETRSVVWDYADELVFCIDEQETPYQGQQLFASAIDYFGIVTAEELKTAILDCDTEEAKRLLEVIKQAMKEYI
jgi:hypothetical protein